MNTIGKRRLLKLAEFLETADLPGEFDMATWAEEEENGRPACGTAACAMGWATTIPSFQRAGLRLNRSCEPSFSGVTQSAAAAEFFNIGRDEASSLFVFHSGRTRGKTARRIVARAIRKLVAESQRSTQP